MKKLRYSLILAVFSGFFASSAFAACDVSDFLVGNPGVTANSCFEIDAGSIGGLESSVESTLGGTWTVFSKFERDEGTDELGNGLNVEITNIYDNGFDWEFTDPSILDPHDDVVFAVKQSTSIFGYLVENISASFGSFFTQNTFNRNDFSFLAALGDGEGDVYSVPEIDASSLGIAISLLLSMVAFIRERRIRK